MAELSGDDRIQALGEGLKTRINDQIRLRTKIESRWYEDLRQYNGRYDAETEQELASDPTRSKVFVNITRNKTNAAEARLTDMLLPTDDRNWGLKPTPVPQLIDAIGDETPAGDSTVGERAEKVIAEASRRAERMQDEIDDQLNEANYNQSCREMIHNACLYGTGILKGPVVVGRTRKAWRKVQDGMGQVAHVLEVVEEKRPAVESVSPWDFFPDMSATRLSDAEFIFERSYMTKRRVRDLMKRPGFLPDQVKRVLQMDPSESVIDNGHLSRMRDISELDSVPDDNRYEVWSYTGPIDREDLLACGCDLDEDDDTAVYDGVIWMIGGIVIKAQLNLLDSDEWSYSVFTWEEDEASIFGFGVPYRMRNPQRVINAAWRMILENAALSTGPQFVYNQEVIEPADGDWKLRPRKGWRIKERNVTVGNAFGTFSIDSHQAELMNIFQSGRHLADEETSLPILAQGEQGQHTTTTLGGMSMLMNSANTVLRRVVKRFDDDVTRPMIGRFYDWNMQFSDKEEIKGDYEVDARGSSALLAKELQAQALMVMAQNFAAHPVFGPLTKARDLYKKVVQAHHLSANDVVKSDEDMQEDARRAQEQGPQKDPQIAKAELSLQAQRERAQLEYQMHQERMQAAEIDRQVKAQIAQAELQIEMMRLAQQKDISLEEVKAALARDAMKVQGKRQEIADEAAIKARFGSGI